MSGTDIYSSADGKRLIETCEMNKKLACHAVGRLTTPYWLTTMKTNRQCEEIDEPEIVLSSFHINEFGALFRRRDRAETVNCQFLCSRIRCRGVLMENGALRVVVTIEMHGAHTSTAE